MCAYVCVDGVEVSVKVKLINIVFIDNFVIDSDLALTRVTNLLN